MAVTIKTALSRVPLQVGTAYRIWFRSETVEGNIARQYADPRSMTAISETVDMDLMLSNPAGAESLDQLEIVSLPDTKVSSPKLLAWLAAPSNCDAVQLITVQTDTGALQWRPGRAAIQGSPSDRELLMSAQIDFAFYEAELRRLEQAILPFETSGPADISLAYDIHNRDRSQWDRLYRTIEDLYQLRMQYARLEPHLIRPSRSLPMPARRIISKLAIRAHIEDRLEALSNRLETCEDVYEGATDRITDFKLYRKGQLLEVAIVILLAAEGALLLWQTVRH